MTEREGRAATRLVLHSRAENYPRVNYSPNIFHMMEKEKKKKNPLSGLGVSNIPTAGMLARVLERWEENTPKGIQIMAALKCYSKIQEAILCPFLNPHHQVNELLFSHSGINECNKAGAVLPGERASVILMELDRVTHNPPLLPQLWWNEEECSHLRQEINIDESHVAKWFNGVRGG